MSYVAEELVCKKYNHLMVKRTFMLDGKRRAVCECDCGETTTKVLASVKFGHVTSCGCQGRATRFQTGRGNQPVNLFADLTDEAVSYWGGFIFGDGSVDKCGKLQIHLTDNNDSVEYLRQLSLFVAGKDLVNHFESKNKCCFQITNQALCSNLAKFGVVPNKTYSQPLIIPNPEMAPHVIRGYFDADGWFSLKKSFVKNTLYQYFTWGICSYLPESMELVQSYLPVKSMLTKKSNQNLYELRVNRQDDVFQLTDYLKPSCESLSFSYKWNKIWLFRQAYKHQSMLVA